MTPRFDYMKASPSAFRAVLALEQFVTGQSEVDAKLLHLIKIRASQINGCAFCIDMHTKEARKAGLDEQWIALICAWKESPCYSDRERAVLAWTDALTMVSREGAPDEVFQPLRAYFNEEEITKLTVAIGTINLWNRLAIAFRSQHPVDVK